MKDVENKPFHYLEKFRFCPLCGSGRFEVSGVRSRRCADCGYELFRNSSAAVAAFIVRGLTDDELNGLHTISADRWAQAELLVCRRACDPVRGTLDLPGGFVDPDETIEQALWRELTEEISTPPAAARYLFSQPNRYSWSGIVVPTADCFFLCTLPPAAALLAADDAECLTFIPIPQLQPALFGLHSIAQGVERFLHEVVNSD